MLECLCFGFLAKTLTSFYLTWPTWVNRDNSINPPFTISATHPSSAKSRMFSRTWQIWRKDLCRCLHKESCMLCTISSSKSLSQQDQFYVDLACGYCYTSTRCAWRGCYSSSRNIPLERFWFKFLIPHLIQKHLNLATSNMHMAPSGANNIQTSTLEKLLNLNHDLYSFLYESQNKRKMF